MRTDSIADALCVLPGVVVVQLGGRGEPRENLELRLLELPGRAAGVGDVLDLGEELRDLLRVVADRGERDARLDHAPAAVAGSAPQSAASPGAVESAAKAAALASRSSGWANSGSRAAELVGRCAPSISQTAWLTRSIRPSREVITLPIGASSNATRSRSRSAGLALADGTPAL